MEIEKITEKIVSGYNISLEEAQSIYDCELEDMLYGANLIREKFKKNIVHLCSIINAKSGLCSQDCKYCSQSVKHAADIKTYALINENELFKALENAVKRGANCFSIVTSGRKPSENEIERICNFLDKAKNYDILLSASLGELEVSSLRELRKAGLKRYHHNLETSENFFGKICTTHSFRDRYKTVVNAKIAGLEVCSGGIFGLGETIKNRLELAFCLRELDVFSVPINILSHIKGTALEYQPSLSKEEILRSIAIYRYILAQKDINICGGRERNLGNVQDKIFYAGANGIMVGGYLTTNARPIEQDLKMIYNNGLTASKLIV